MSPVILLIVLVVELGYLYFKPLNPLIAREEGKTKAESQNDINQLMKGNEKGKWITLVLVMYLLNFIIEPLYVIQALQAEIGSKAFAIAALAVIFLTWAEIARSAKADKNSPAVVHPRPIDKLVRQIVFSIPLAYLAYLFLVIIKVIG